MNDKALAALAAYNAATPERQALDPRPDFRPRPRFNPTFAAKMARERDDRRAAHKRQRASRKANR